MNDPIAKPEPSGAGHHSAPLAPFLSSVFCPLLGIELAPFVAAMA